MNRTLTMTDLPDELAKVIPQTNVRYLEKQPCYKDAKKSGMDLHAFNTVKNCLRPEKVQRIAAQLRGNAPVYIIPVLVNRKEPSLNKLPICMAFSLQNILEHWSNRTASVSIVENIIGKAPDVKTGTGIKARLGSSIEFSGGIPDDSLNAQYVLVDDVFTLGGSIRGLLEHVVNQGARVKAVSTLACSRFGGELRPIPEQMEKIYQYGINNDQIKEVCGYGIDKFTGAEIRAINGFYRDKNPERFRELFPERDQGYVRGNPRLGERESGVYEKDSYESGIGID